MMVSMFQTRLGLLAERGSGNPYGEVKEERAGGKALNSAHEAKSMPKTKTSWKVWG
jgi:hypothetical protein